MKAKSNQTGFSFVEMAIVIIILGSLLAITFPYLKIFALDTKRKSVNADLSDALNALKGYAYAKGAFPDWPDDGGGVDIVNQLPTAKLGLHTKSGFEDFIYYDVNDALQFADEVNEAAGQSLTTLCADVLAEIAKVETATTADDPEPRICNATASCNPATIADQTSVALVLISRAKNTILDNNNGDGDRVYENANRGEDNNYDDVMLSMTLYELSDFINCTGGPAGGTWGNPWGGGGGSVLNCGAVSPSVVLYNSGTIDMYAQQENEVCWAISPGNYAAFCRLAGWGGRRGGSIRIDISEQNDCNIGIANGQRYTETAGSDTNGDGDILITCADDYTTCTVD